MPRSSASHACPACGREIDPLRAGQVAVLEGGFVYFCDQACKVRWAKARGGVASDDVETAEPPPVAPAPEPAPEPVAVSAPETPKESEGEVERDDEPRSLPLRHWGAPEEVVSVARPEPRVAPSAGPARSRGAWLGYGGAVAGTLAIGVALVGAAGDALRLPLAIIACSCALAYAAAIAERLLVRTLWPGAVAVVVAGGCAIASRALGAADAHALASFAGVTAASFVAVCATMLRAVEPVTAARESILAALELPARASDGGSRAESEVRAGEQVEVAEGELVPVDGVVSGGEATVSPWLDSGNEVHKREGAPVIAGARVLSGALRVVASWTGPDRAYVKLLATDRHRIELAAPLARLARLFDTRALVPLGLLSGAGAFANGASLLESFACGAAALASFGAPVVSVSVALLHARGHLRSLRHGVVHRDAAHFDRAGRAGIAVVCARGTVLLGEPEIVAIEPVGDREPSEVLALAAAMCTGSSHPFAAAVLRAARARHVKPENVRNPVHIGSGATALDASGERIVLGRR
ncbi:MAG TPA: hypothetical protein VLM85_09675, partial [Polyangiaceae bacterium]|nr:hypothetical protein [Polyangiaceae bacterium]